MRSRARLWQARHGLGLIVIDYLQLVQEADAERREAAVARVSRNCKCMAKELGVPVFALSQLNDEGKLRESRAIGPDANLILMIQPEEDGPGNVTPVLVSKHRNGRPKQTLRLRFDRPTYRWY